MVASALLVTSVVVFVLVVAVLASAVEVVEAGQPRVLLVFGEAQAVLQPGLNVVPPFVSTTYPVDVESRTFDTGDRRVDLPDELAAEVEAP